MGLVDQGLAHLRARDPAAAIQSFRAAVEAEPGDAAAWRGMVRAAIELRIWREVAANLERLLPLVSSRAELAPLLLLRGQVLDLHLGDAAGARPLYEKGLLYQPDRAWPYLALAEIDLRLRRWSRSAAHADHGLELCAQDAPERPWLWLTKAVAGQRISVSMGPQSTFFRGLRGPEAQAEDPGEKAWRKAAARLPELVGSSYRAWLQDEAAAVAFIHDRMPRPPLAL